MNSNLDTTARLRETTVGIVLMSDVIPHPEIKVRRIHSNEAVMTVQLAGQIKFEGTAPLQVLLLEQLTAARPRCVIIDCAEVTFIDSQGLSMLLTLHRWCKANESHMSIHNPNTFVRDLLRLTRVDTYLEVR